MSDERHQARGPFSLALRCWRRAAVRSVKRFGDEHLTDWAAALTYYAVLAVFPALVVLVALLGLVGQYPETTNALLEIVAEIGPSATVETLRGPIEGVVRSKESAGLLIAFGILGALWSASAYVGAFTRAANSIYGVDEERPFWKRRPIQIAITIAVVLSVAVLAIAIVLTGDLARAVGHRIGLEDTAVDVWSLAKWPLLMLAITTIVATLYYVAPDVRHEGFRWITPGGVLAVVLWLAASAGFAVYVSNLGSYNKTYGTLGTVIVFLIWLWISNLAMLLGALFNAELENARAIEAEGDPRPGEAVL